MFINEHVLALKMLLSEVYATSSCLLDAAFELVEMHIIEV